MPAPLVSLEGASYEAWLRAKSSHFRSRMRRGLRKLEERGATLRLAAADEVADDLQAFADLHYARWRKRGGSAVLRPGVERMLLAVAKEHAATGRFRVWSVDLDGRTISVQLFLAAGGEAAYWLGGFDEEAGHFHPGLAILTVLRAIEHSFEQGERRLDLGGGGQPFKYEFGSDEETLEWMTVVLPTRRAVLARLQFLPLRVRLWLAGVLPTGIKRQLSRLRAGRRSPGR